MGIKSTTELTREQAEARMVDLLATRYTLSFEAYAARLTDVELEDALEDSNDALAEAEGSVGFDNFRIVD